jgi:3-(3-hydroxy-phenyl)propionate hydroxylase
MGDRQALIVGAGPVGLAAALALRSQGLPATVLEAGPEDQPRVGSRAIYVHRETLERLEAIHPGLGWDLARHGLVWGVKRTCWGGREVFSRTYPRPDLSSLPPFTSLAQTETERLLADACKRAGVEMVWDTVVSVASPSEEAVVLSTASGPSWSAPYVIGADGGHSAIRSSLGIAMAGSRSERSFVIVDVEEDPSDPLPLERVFHYHHPAVGRRNVLLVPFSGGWRVDLQCRPGDDPSYFSGEGVAGWLARVLPSRYAGRISWVSTYRFLQVLAKAFTDPYRRVLLAGEAAHLFAPFGARGMNSGVADAVAAAESIRRALEAPDRGTAREAIDGFARTRQAAARYNRAAAGAALDHMQGRGLALGTKRLLAAQLALAGRRAGAWLDSAPYGPRGGAFRSGPGRY